MLPAATRFNSRAQRYFDRRKKSTMNLANGLTGSTDLEDNVTCDATAVLLKKGSTISCSILQFALWQHLKGFSFLCTEIYIIAKQLGHQPSIFGQLQEEIVMDDFINKVSVLSLSLYEAG